MRRACVSIPHGLPVNGSWLRELPVREMNGRDEELLSETAEQTPLSRAGRLVESLVELDEGDGDLLARLTLGDVTAVMLHLRRMMFGDLMQCVLGCPACAGELWVELTVSQLIEKLPSKPQTEYESSLGPYSLRLRPVTVRDLLSVGGERLAGERSPAESLVRSCVLGSEPELPAKMDDELIAQMSSRLSELDPQADLILDLACPTCGHGFKAPFFPEDFLLREIDARQPQLEREVHWLAFNYHWSEEAIMSLPVGRRKRYVELINRTLSGEAV